ncbi:MAG: LysR substrate-binding domain-containing protein [Bacteroidota bacterium]
MNLQQLEYIVAVDEHRHFGKAAKSCQVTQPTLSMMIQKLEVELDTKIFDRSKKPVIPTEVGLLVIAQARKICKDLSNIHEIVNQQKETIQGSLNLGIIPTLAPYLLPLFIKRFIEKYPKIRLKISEHTTEVIMQYLKSGKLDVGLMATPLGDSSLKENPLFYEKFLIYTNNEYEKEFLLPEDIDPKQLWLLEEGHCFRTQIANLCELRKQVNLPLQYETGSIETLIKLVDHQYGITILPELAGHSLAQSRKYKLKSFKSPAPVRQISLVTHRDFVKRRLIIALQEEIMAGIPKHVQENAILHRKNIQPIKKWISD